MILSTIHWVQVGPKHLTNNRTPSRHKLLHLNFKKPTKNRMVDLIFRRMQSSDIEYQKMARSPISNNDWLG